jgi:hypothetical protein
METWTVNQYQMMGFALAPCVLVGAGAPTASCSGGRHHHSAVSLESPCHDLRPAVNKFYKLDFALRRLTSTTRPPGASASSARFDQDPEQVQLLAPVVFYYRLFFYLWGSSSSLPSYYGSQNLGRARACELF